MTDLDFRKVACMVSSYSFVGMRVAQDMPSMNPTDFHRLLDIANDAHAHGRTLVINGRGATNPCPERTDTAPQYNVRRLYEDFPDHIKDVVRPLANANLRCGQSMQQALENAILEVLPRFHDYCDQRFEQEVQERPEEVVRMLLISPVRNRRAASQPSNLSREGAHD